MTVSIGMGRISCVRPQETSTKETAEIKKTMSALPECEKAFLLEMNIRK